jgi:hypothetical protein
MACKRFDEMPTYEQIREVKESIGGGCCIQEYIFELVKNESGEDEISKLKPEY